MPSLPLRRRRLPFTATPHPPRPVASTSSSPGRLHLPTKCHILYASPSSACRILTACPETATCVVDLPICDFCRRWQVARRPPRTRVGLNTIAGVATFGEPHKNSSWRRLNLL